MTGLHIDKYVIFDLQAFQKLIDELGGIEVNVLKKLVDNAYPGEGVSYIKVSFNQGIQTMDGAKALKYARSRESTSDFDRSGRQQIIINAVAAKLKAMDFIRRLDLATNLYNKIIAYIETDINLLEAISYYGSYNDYKINLGNIMSTQNILKSSKNEKGQYILKTKENGYGEIKSFVLEAIKK
jgi:anionic cell wall polymer biosynthesis LytR-Cps2A-Psr (LCP) family protein